MEKLPEFFPSFIDFHAWGMAQTANRTPPKKPIHSVKSVMTGYISTKPMKHIFFLILVTTIFTGCAGQVSDKVELKTDCSWDWQLEPMNDALLELEAQSGFDLELVQSEDPDIVCRSVEDNSETDAEVILLWYPMPRSQYPSMYGQTLREVGNFLNIQTEPLIQ